ncbi:SDR family oxidoreductase [Ancylobacter sp. FA202]|uniref:SDR family oxidoreductase n=1 Tax=Ancylobacter sp. FA202 TaxID=1111106 RepID=UPI00036A4172|nr:NmrA family NAD(P)-binding protein [Ancylobacter sp. FA202]
MAISGPILVFLAGGVQGGAVVHAAYRRGYPVRRLVRTPHSPEHPGIETLQGDLDDPESLALACAGVAHLVLQVPTGAPADMVARARAAVDAARRAGVRSLVLKLASASRPSPCAEPSFVANAAVEAVVRAAGIPAAIVRPTLYLDNLLKPSARADIVNYGIFAPPIAAEQRIAWTSAEDCAEAAVLLLERDAYGGDHRIAGTASVTGHELVGLLSRGVGKPIDYRAQPIDEFEEEVDRSMGSGAGRRIASKFRYFAEHPDEAADILARPYQPSPALAGFTPTSIQEWISRHARRFR